MDQKRRYEEVVMVESRETEQTTKRGLNILGEKLLAEGLIHLTTNGEEYGGYSFEEYREGSAYW